MLRLRLALMFQTAPSHASSFVSRRVATAPPRPLSIQIVFLSRSLALSQGGYSLSRDPNSCWRRISSEGERESCGEARADVMCWRRGRSPSQSACRPEEVRGGREGGGEIGSRTVEEERSRWTGEENVVVQAIEMNETAGGGEEREEDEVRGRNLS